MENNNNESNIGGGPAPGNLESQADPIIDQSKDQSLEQPISQLQEQTIDQPSDSPEQPEPPMQPTNQPLDPQAHPINQPASQPAVSSLGVEPSNINNKKKKTKTTIIISSIIGAILVVVTVILLVFFLNKNSEKTVSCTSNISMYGIDMNGKTEILVGDGAILGGSMVVSVDFKNMDESYADYEKTIVDSAIEEYKYQCKDYCSFDNEYVEKDHLTLTLTYDKKGIDKLVVTSGIEDKSAQEIADKIQKDSEERGATCKQY